MANVTDSYTYFRQGAEVARTIQVTPDVIFDLDENDRIIGAEVLGGTDWASGFLALAAVGRLAVPEKGDLWP